MGVVGMAAGDTVPCTGMADCGGPGVDLGERDAAGCEHQRPGTTDAAAGDPYQHQPHHFYPIKQMQLQRFDGVRWVRFGAVIGN